MASLTTLIELTDADGRTRRVPVAGRVEIGREAQLAVRDERASRRHLEVQPGADGRVTVVDLGSANGTFVNGVRALGPVAVGPGDVVTFAGCRLRVVVEAPARAAPPAPPPPPGVVPPAPPAPPAPPPPSTPAPAAPAVAVARRPALDELVGRSGGGITVRSRPGTAGDRMAADVLVAAQQARAALAGFGSEGWGVEVQLCLVDPFPDPAHPGEVISDGTVLDAERHEVWMVVDDRTPPEPVGRALALLFGAVFPAHDELEPYLEGYGLLRAGSPDRTDQLRGRGVPGWHEADGDLRAAMATSFVAFLVAAVGDDALRRFFASARPGSTDDAARAQLGASLAELDARWRSSLAAEAPGAPAASASFLRLALTHLRPHAGRQVELFVHLLLSLAFATAFPFVTRRLLDTAIPSGKWSEVLQLLGILGAAFVVSLLAQVRQQYVSAYVSSSIVRALRGSMFSRLQVLPGSWYARHDQGDVISRVVSDVEMVETGLSNLLQDGLGQIVALAVSLVVCVTLDWRLALVTAVGAPIIAIVFRRMRAGAMRRSMEAQEESGKLMTVVAENLQAQQVVKAFSLERREEQRFDRAAGGVFDAEMRMSVFGGWFMMSVQMVVTLLRLGVMAFGAWLIVEGELTIGAFVAFTSVMGQVLEPVAGLTTLGQQVQQSMGALQRVREVTDATPDIRDAVDARPIGPLTAELRVTAASFGYTPERRVLDGVDLVVPAGTRTAIVGASGSGKSTLLQLLVRAHDPDAGRVTWDGVDLRAATLDSLRASTGVVFQDTFAFDDTIRENIRLGRLDASDADVEAAARQAELHDFVLTLPQGYDTIVGERGGLLSGGQRQRLAIARALIRRPSLLVLDEATSALDARTERAIAATLDRVAAGRTTVAVTHRLGTVTAYEQIVVMADGRIVERGTHAQLLALGGTYAALWAEQHAGADAAAPPPAPVAGRRLTRMTGALTALPPPPPVPLAPPAVRATGTFGAIR